jgi:hypothetical protein
MRILPSGCRKPQAITSLSAIRDMIGLATNPRYRVIQRIFQTTNFSSICLFFIGQLSFQQPDQTVKRMDTVYLPGREEWHRLTIFNSKGCGQPGIITVAIPEFVSVQEADIIR